MPYDAYGNEIPSKAEKKTGLIRFGDIGGIGQLVYHNFRFADYRLEFDAENRVIVIPVISAEKAPDMSQKENLDGKEILTSLCDLARAIDSYETKENFQDLILQWCRTHMHPYQIDELFNELTDEDFEAIGFLAEFASRDGTFLMDDFLRDLGNLYNAARFYIALDGVTMAEENAAYNLYQQGRFFESSPKFEKYKYRSPELPDGFDFSEAKGDPLKAMVLAEKYLAEHPVEQPPEGDRRSVRPDAMG